MEEATKNKAKELIEKFQLSGKYIGNERLLPGTAKECALICVDEILELLSTFLKEYVTPANSKYEFYQEVRAIIEQS